MNDKEYSFRDDLSPESRAAEVVHTIDPGFVHYRKIETILGPQGMSVIDDMISKLPDLPDWQKRVRMDHIYSQVMLWFCELNEIKTLEEVLATQKGRLFCSTETLAPCPDVYDLPRVTSAWVPRGPQSHSVQFEYSTTHIHSDTLHSRLGEGAPLAIVAQLSRASGSLLVFDPLVMGFPWLQLANDPSDYKYAWYAYHFYEHFVEDIDEFRKVRDIPVPADPEPMRQVSELAFKACLQKLVGDSAANDWGGEASDYFGAHMHLNGRRVTAAFLLKGPARFAPMGLNHLGKNNDQILRLSHEPADVLIVQHCHDILSPVRETLRAFAVQPSRPRRYCLIDGRDSLRLLQAYDLYDWAVEMSHKT